MSFFWYQITGGKEAWHECLSELREDTLKTKRPAYMTVLDVHSLPNADWEKDDYDKMKFSGPLYFDWDAESLDVAITHFHEFIEKLKADEVNLNCVRLYATGGRGFHMEIPQQMFIPKVPKGGIAHLPAMYRFIANKYAVDTLDLSIYSARKGRMWRTMGVQRTNGKYKVPITLEQAMAMTPELYDELCSVCVTQELELPEPVYSNKLGTAFKAAQDEVERGIKNRSKAGKDLALLAKFNGQWPPTLEAIMRGENLAHGVGFHKIAQQLAITANALGKSAEELVAASEGLCKNHSSDSERYGSPRKRKEELRRMHGYMADNVCYTYSKGGVRSLLDPSVPTPDLDDSAKTSGVGTIDESDDDAGQTDEQKAEMSAAAAHLVGGAFITKDGMHIRSNEGPKTISNISLRKPILVKEGVGRHRGLTLGIEAEVTSDGEKAGRAVFTDREFVSRSALNSKFYSYNGIFQGTDNNASSLRLILARAAKGAERVIYAVHREGLDVVEDPATPDEARKDVIWVHHQRVFADERVKTQYTFQPLATTGAMYKADVHNATPIAATPDTLESIRALLSVNSPTVTAQMVGWFVSAFHRQFYHHTSKQFPLLHPNGSAGSGKTQTSSLMARMHYFKEEELARACGVASTTYSIKGAIASSASIPLLLDEYKPSEMGEKRTNELLQAFRIAYNQGVGASGGISSGSAVSSFRDVTELPYSAPICFMAEAQETQTAIAQRSLPVFFSSKESSKHTEAYQRALAGKDDISALGKLLLVDSFYETVESRRAAVVPIENELRKLFDQNIHDRQVFNLAVVLAGLNFLDRSLQKVFKDDLRADVDRLRQAIYDHKYEINQTSMSESAKMMNHLSLITQQEDSESPRGLREGRDYIVKDGYLEMNMNFVFTKYLTWCKDRGVAPFFLAPESFMSSMGKFSPVLDKVCPLSPLKTSEQAKVFRFDTSLLAAEGVEPFKTKGR